MRKRKRKKRKKKKRKKMKRNVLSLLHSYYFLSIQLLTVYVLLMEGENFSQPLSSVKSDREIMHARQKNIIKIIKMKIK